MSPCSSDRTSLSAPGLPILISGMVISPCSSDQASRSSVGQTHGSRSKEYMAHEVALPSARNLLLLTNNWFQTSVANLTHVFSIMPSSGVALHAF
eukprot:12818209-Alexandrium_andersonii.AAC.1